MDSNAFHTSFDHASNPNYPFSPLHPLGPCHQTQNRDASDTALFPLVGNVRSKREHPAPPPACSVEEHTWVQQQQQQPPPFLSWLPRDSICFFLDHLPYDIRLKIYGLVLECHVPRKVFVKFDAEWREKHFYRGARIQYAAKTIDLRSQALTPHSRPSHRHHPHASSASTASKPDMAFHPFLWPPLLRLCPQIRAEATPLFYSTTPFIAPYDPHTVPNWEARLPLAALQALTANPSLHVEHICNETNQWLCLRPYLLNPLRPCPTVARPAAVRALWGPAALAPRQSLSPTPWRFHLLATIYDEDELRRPGRQPPSSPKNMTTDQRTQKNRVLAVSSADLAAAASATADAAAIAAATLAAAGSPPPADLAAAAAAAAADAAAAAAAAANPAFCDLDQILHSEILDELARLSTLPPPLARPQSRHLARGLRLYFANLHSLHKFPAWERLLSWLSPWLRDPEGEVVLEPLFERRFEGGLFFCPDAVWEEGVDAVLAASERNLRGVA